jgi:hypothetical protein
VITSAPERKTDDARGDQADRFLVAVQAAGLDRRHTKVPDGCEQATRVRLTTPRFAKGVLFIQIQVPSRRQSLPDVT